MSELVWHKIETEEDLPVKPNHYLIVIKLKYDHEKDYRRVGDYAWFVGRNAQGCGDIDDYWMTSNDWDEGEQFIKVTHWAEFPNLPPDI